MSNNKKSSIDWLVSELTNLGYIFAPSFGHKIIDEKIKQAKAMHKEEIVESWSNGYDEEDRATSNPIKYYEQTYGGNNEP